MTWIHPSRPRTASKESLLGVDRNRRGIGKHLTTYLEALAAMDRRQVASTALSGGRLVYRGKLEWLLFGGRRKPLGW